MKILRFPNYILLFISFYLLSSTEILSQQQAVEYGEVETLEIGGIEVKGTFFSDPNAIKSVAGLKVGQVIKIPGIEITKAMRNLWKLRLFDDVQIKQDKRVGNIVFLSIHLMERARLANWSYRGINQSMHDDLNEIVTPFLIKGQVAGTAMQINAKNAIRKHFIEKGYFDVEVTVSEESASDRANAVNLIFDINPHEKIKVAEVSFVGNEAVADYKLQKLVKETKAKRNLLKKSKYVEADYEADKQHIIDYYHTIGYRDARIVKDSFWRVGEGLINLQLTMDEGRQYYFGDITWKGNTIHDSESLTRILGIRKGEIYNEELLESRLHFSIDGRDVSSIYLDDGYLFFTVEPTEVSVVGDTIDLEMRIFEGPQATIDEVIIKGNTRTHEHVIRRELRTQPGQKFSRSDIIRSQRQIIALGYFNPEALGIETPVDQTNGTVDIIYTVEERPSDQLELSAGWGGYGRSKVIGTLGVTFNNFSLRNLFNREAWSPLPQGDGQRLSVRAQTNGDFFQSYNFSFTEPWLGGKRPNSFTIGGVLTKYKDYVAVGGGRLDIGRAFVGLGSRLKWPDDNFISNTTLNIENLFLKNYSAGGFVDQFGQPITNGNFHNFSISQTIARTTINEPTFPRSGSTVSLTLQITPPYRALGVTPSSTSAQELYRWVEYHKWRFDVEWYTPIIGKMVLKTGAKMGFLGYYNKSVGPPPFERYIVGGDGLSNQQTGITGNDIIAMRGYEVENVSANLNGGSTVFNKFTVEVRYPLSLNPSSTVFGLLFLEGTNAWKTFQDYNPFELRRCAGVGVRAYLPMFGLLGFDFGYGWDQPAKLLAGAKWSEFGNFNIVLGFEPD